MAKFAPGVEKLGTSSFASTHANCFPAYFLLTFAVLELKAAAKTEHEHQVTDGKDASRWDSGILKQKESAIRRYFYDSLAAYLSVYVRPEDEIVELDPRSAGLGVRFANYRAVPSIAMLKTDRQSAPNYILLNGTVHYERDIQKMLNQLQEFLKGSERILLVYYSMLWKPLARFASRIGMRSRTPEQNWIAHQDLENFCHLADLEIIRHEPKLLCPIPIPFLANFLNRYLAPLPFFRLFTVLNIVIARPPKNGEVVEH